MTPFGRRVRELRAERSITQKQMAADLGVSAAYLSALEKGYRGAPSWQFVQRIITYFNIIWDDAEELQTLARTSHPRVMVDTAGLSPEATELANLLAACIGELGQKDILAIIHEVRSRASRGK
ncbi:helix-turn-helix domain-containing protein [Salaquimonas pukyongi]|uniref:helix-turn-helix domain-containing protein n=1 Tax=Salaquimonas pukyongi TaxID=2712698 RepID=UPI00096B8C5E|nr:helix-turn-helix transcriptional regulator [Salaquimonas pukyongi]